MPNIKSVSALQSVRFLLIATLVTLTISPALTNIIEAVIYLLFIFNSDLRNRFCIALRQPMVWAGMAVLGSVAAATLWSVASWEVRLDTLISTRKVLLLPMSAAVFSEDIWKRKAIITFFSATFTLAVISWFCHLSGITIYRPPNELVRNDVIQSMFFCSAAFAAFALLFFDKSMSPKMRYFLIAGSIILLLNVLIIGTSRSGYLALLAMPATFIFLSIKKYKWALMASVAIIMALALTLSSTAHREIDRAITNTLNYKESEEATSLGYRMIFWENSIAMIKDAPILGYGTGGFEDAYRERVKDIEGWHGTVANDPHNQYLISWAEQGLPGLLILLFFIYTCFRQKEISKPYQVAAYTVMVTWLGTSFFNGHFGTYTEGRFIFLWMGIMLTSCSLLEQKKSKPVSAPSK